MLKILKDYYHMDISYVDHGYFEYQNRNYYITKVGPHFLELYSYYDFMVHSLNITGFKILRNCFQQVFSQGYVVLYFEYETIDINLYLANSLKNIPLGGLSIKEIKESWICKIDALRDEISKYAYSFQYDRDLNALMHYYSGMAENGICILNEILMIQKDAQISLSLALNHPIQAYYYELLNPCHYTISSKAKHIIHLLESHIIDLSILKQLIEQSYFQIYELLYLYARLFYCSHFFDCVLTKQIDVKTIQYYLKKYKEDIEQIKLIKNLISQYISIPEISWIDEKNML